MRTMAAIVWAVWLTSLFSQPAHAEKRVAPVLGNSSCVLGPADLNHHREFSVPRNGVCVIKRSSLYKLDSIRVTVPPKRGRFGSASISESAYRAGNIPGNDYFEYISTELLANGTKEDFRIRNVVHITPQGHFFRSRSGQPTCAIASFCSAKAFAVA